MVSQKKLGRNTVNFSGGFKAQWYGDCLVGRVFVEYLLHLLRNPTTEAALAAGGTVAPRKPTTITCSGLVQK